MNFYIKIVFQEEKIKNVPYYDMVDNNNRTALFYASFSGRRQALLTLLKVGANINIRDNNGLYVCFF